MSENERPTAATLSRDHIVRDLRDRHPRFVRNLQERFTTRRNFKRLLDRDLDLLNHVQNWIEAGGGSLDELIDQITFELCEPEGGGKPPHRVHADPSTVNKHPTLEEAQARLFDLGVELGTLEVAQAHHMAEHHGQASDDVARDIQQIRSRIARLHTWVNRHTPPARPMKQPEDFEPAVAELIRMALQTVGAFHEDERLAGCVPTLTGLGIAKLETALASILNADLAHIREAAGYLCAWDIEEDDGPDCDELDANV